jgi:hypothetical protein
LNLFKLGTDADANTCGGFGNIYNSQIINHPQHLTPYGLDTEAFDKYPTNIIEGDDCNMIRDSSFSIVTGYGWSIEGSVFESW